MFSYTACNTDKTIKGNDCKKDAKHTKTPKTSQINRKEINSIVFRS